MIPLRSICGYQISNIYKLDDEAFLKVHLLLNTISKNAVDIAIRYSCLFGRSFVTSMDVEYALKYLARQIIENDNLIVRCDNEYDNIIKGNKWGDITEDDDDKVDGCLPGFNNNNNKTDVEFITQVNQCYDEWNDWDPVDILQVTMKHNIENMCTN